MHGDPRAGQKAAQLARVLALRDGVEAAVEDAGARLEFGEQPALRARRGARLGGQTAGLGPLEIAPQSREVGRVLAHQELDGEVAGVEQAREGGQAGRVQLNPDQFGQAEPDPVQPHGALVVEVREHEAERQRRQRRDRRAALRRRVRLSLGNQ